jgi:serine O-acetyltransferase
MNNYNIRLKEVIKPFTKRLFYNLFDEREEDSIFLKNTFLDITDQLSIENASKLWGDFQQEFLSIRKNWI